MIEDDPGSVLDWLNDKINVEVLDKLPTRPHQELKLSYVFETEDILYVFFTQGTSVSYWPIPIDDNELALRRTGLTIEELFKKAEEFSQGL